MRAIHAGEGDYAQTESEIRTLLGTSVLSPLVPDATPDLATTPETYLGFARLDRSRYAGSRPVAGRPAQFALATRVRRDAISYGGQWTLSDQWALAGTRARLELHFHARDVYIVLGGKGRVTTLLNGKPLGSIAVDSARLYTALSSKYPRDGLLEFRFTPGIKAYSFTFG